MAAMEGRDQQQERRSRRRTSILDAAMDLAEGMSLPLSVVWASIKSLSIGDWLSHGVDDTAPRAPTSRPHRTRRPVRCCAGRTLCPIRPSAPAHPPVAVAHARRPAMPSLFSGNRHDGATRLFFDRRLTPLERNAWQVFRLMLNDDGATAFPDLRAVAALAGVVCCQDRPARNRGAGTDTDAPDPLAEPGARRRDPRPAASSAICTSARRTPDCSRPCSSTRLPATVSQALGHSAKAVQIVGLHTLKEIGGRPIAGRTHPPVTVAGVMAERLANQGLTASDSYPQEDAIHDSEEAPEPSSESNAPTESEAGSKPRQTPLRNRSRPYSTLY